MAIIDLFDRENHDSHCPCNSLEEADHGSLYVFFFSFSDISRRYWKLQIAHHQTGVWYLCFYPFSFYHLSCFLKTELSLKYCYGFRSFLRQCQELLFASLSLLIGMGNFSEIPTTVLIPTVFLELHFLAVMSFQISAFYFTPDPCPIITFHIFYLFTYMQ